MILSHSLFAGVGQTSHLVTKVSCVNVVENKPVSRFETEISNAYNSIKQLRIESEDILEVQARISQGGAFALAVLRVRTAQGVFAFKIYNQDTPLKELAPSLVIQNGFAERKLAPHIRGVMSSAHVAKLLQKFPKAQKMIQDQEVSFGVLMDEVPIVTHVTQKRISGSMPALDRESIEKRLREIEKAFSEMRILIPEDLQLVIDKNNQLLLLDFDTYAHFTKEGMMIAAFSTSSTDVQSFANTSYRRKENLRNLQKKEYEVEFPDLRKTLGL